MKITNISKKKKLELTFQDLKIGDAFYAEGFKDTYLKVSLDKFFVLTGCQTLVKPDFSEKFPVTRLEIQEIIVKEAE